MKRIDYQDTPEASKGNAFCWKTWAPDIDWCPPAPQGRPRDTTEISRAQSQRIEERRAAGEDPLHIAGLGSQRKFNIKQFAVAIPGRKAAA